MLEQLELPIIVEVFDDHYECYSTHPIPSLRDLVLLATLAQLNGVNENVAKGRYYFNATQMGDDALAVSLTPFME